LVFPLIAAGAVAHAAWNLILKRVGQSTPAVLWWINVVGAVLIAPVGIATLVAVTFQPGWMAIAAVCGVFEVIYFLLLQRGYRDGDVSLVYPLARGTGPTMSVAGAMLFLGERPSGVTLIGVVVIVAGIGIISTAGSRTGTRAPLSSVLYGLGVGVMLACFTVWDGWAVKHVGVPPIGYFWMAIVAQAMLFTPFAIRERGVIATFRRHPVAITAIGLLGPASYMLALTAITLSSVTLVAPAREISVILVALGGAFFFGEKHVVQRVIGSVIVVTGVALLAVG
jgi:drug/metabolite transporter (DMT)-like permease